MAPHFTCLACSVVFDDAEVQRAHYKTDWHRYNLKRKVAELPPVTFGEFQNKVEWQRQKKEEKVKDDSKSCKQCSKSFSSANAFENHLKSKKHKESLEKAQSVINSKGKQLVSKKSSKHQIKPKAGYLPPVNDDGSCDDNSDEWEDIDEEDTEDEVLEEADGPSDALPQTFCLFCPHESVSVLENLRHMTKSHSFFLPDLPYVTDIEALMVYLGAKVGDGKVCLYCNNHSKQFQTTRSCQTHMVDKGHCMLDYEGDAILEYADFYDFSSSYPDTSEETDIDEELSSNMADLNVDPDTLELILPSGARAGHRALRKYFKQSVPEHFQERNRPMITAMSKSQCTALGLSERTLSTAIRKRIEARKLQNTKRAQYSLSIGVKANKLQQFFRQQNMYCG